LIPALPQFIRNVKELETLLSEPSANTVRSLCELGGDVVILGTGGKMGPTLARMARRALGAAGGNAGRVIAVSRFSSRQLEERLNSWNVETIRCELLDRRALARLPEAPNVIYMAGMKFGSTGNEPLTWAMNSYLPGLICERYAKSRIAAFSTGNVYGLCEVAKRGSEESSPLHPVGEYAMSCLGRERIFDYFSRANGTRVAILRLNYATEMRYGVLVDIAQKVFAGRPVPLSMGYLNAVWQGDANNFCLQALGEASSPALVLNIAGPEVLSVRRVAEQFAARFQKAVQFEGTERPDALLSDARKCYRLFGKPLVNEIQMIDWIAGWIAAGGETLSKPTHFENRAGRF
jgi:nucleoside-diphosphate-sugar epimerase